MAADTTSAEKIVHVTLTADTNHSINLTGGPKPCRRVELIHHGGDATEPVYFKSYTTEPDDDLSGGGTAGEEVLLAGDRLVQNVVQPADGSGVWIELISAGTPTVSVRALPGGK